MKKNIIISMSCLLLIFAIIFVNKKEQNVNDTKKLEKVKVADTTITSRTYMS